MTKFDLKRVITFVCTCGASVYGSSVGEQTSAEWLVESRDGRGEWQCIFIGCPDELMCLRADVGDAATVTRAKIMIHTERPLFCVGIFPVGAVRSAEVVLAIVFEDGTVFTVDLQSSFNLQGTLTHEEQGEPRVLVSYGAAVRQPE